MESLEVFLTPPPSLNKARMARKVNIGGGRQSARIQDTEVLRSWKVLAQGHLDEQITEVPSWVKEHADKQGTFQFEVFWYGGHWFKNGNPKRRDIDNRVKFLMDQVFKTVNIDDCHVFKLNLFKLPPQEEPHELAGEDGEICRCRIEKLEAPPCF